MPDSDRKPSLVWFKAQAPGLRADGSSMVSLAMATHLAKQWDIHLVCLKTPSLTSDPAVVCVPPFSSVIVAKAGHQQTRRHRLVLGTWYHLLDRAGLKPLDASIEGSRPVSRALRDVVERTNATAAVLEYWTAGCLIDALGPIPSTLIVHDVAHLMGDRMTPSFFGRRRSAMIKRAELAACRRASNVAFLSTEDRDAFEELGVRNGTVVPVPVDVPGPIDAAELPAGQQSDKGTTALFLGGLDWWPNREALNWLLDLVWPCVVEQRPDAELLVVGTGRREDAVPGVSFTGFVSDLASLLAEAHVGVVPTVSGTGVKTKTLEMLKAGLPIVATANGVRGTSAGEAGALITDDPHEFARHIVTLLDSGALRRELSRAGRTALTRVHSADGLSERLFP